MIGLTPTEGWIFLACCVCTVLLAGAYRRFALARSILDLPNARSSHREPVPRGGGSAVIVVFLASACTYLARSQANIALSMLLVAAATVGLIGWLDDRRPTRVSTRLAIHVIAAATVVYAGITSHVALAVALWWGFCALSAINVVNFMDGIDALVTSQVVIFALTLTFLAPVGSAPRAFALALAAASLGFLFWNRPPARLFLGDVGSGFLGFTCVAIGLLVALATDHSMLRIFLPAFPLVLDATITLLRRIRNGERVTEPHRSHLYQRLANGGWGHRNVSLSFGACALVGAILSLSPIRNGWWMLVGLYVIAIVGIGWRADWNRPFPQTPSY